MLCLVAHINAGRVTPAARAPAPRHFRGSQSASLTMDGHGRLVRSDRVSLVATRRPAASRRTPKAPATKCSDLQREVRERIMQGPPRGMDYRGVPRRGSEYGAHCDMPSDSGMLACSF